MSTVGQREIQTQKRVIAFFKDALGADDALVDRIFEIVKAQYDY